jgi:DNA-binding MarR family transcriptional regulator
MKPDGLDAKTASAIHLLHRAGQCADELFATNIGTSDLTPRQFAVLRALDENDEPSQAMLVEKTGIDRSTMADIIRRLVARSLVNRRRTRRDARMYAVRLTDKGRSVLNSADPAVRLTDERILSALPQAQREQFLKSLLRVIELLGQQSKPVAVSQSK